MMAKLNQQDYKLICTQMNGLVCFPMSHSFSHPFLHFKSYNLNLTLSIGVRDGGRGYAGGGGGGGGTTCAIFRKEYIIEKNIMMIKCEVFLYFTEVLKFNHREKLCV